MLGPLCGGLFLGWALGANDAANVFGTAVAARIVPYRKACVLCGLAVILGAYMQGQAGIDTLSGLTDQTVSTLIITTVAAAITVTLMTIFKLPVSTSQAIVGAITGIGLATGDMNWTGLEKVLICWVSTPLGAMLIACVVYKILDVFITRVPMSMLTRDKILWSGLLVMGTYGSYALGANNVANATGIFVNKIPLLTSCDLALLGGVAIAAGTFSSKRVMLTVGTGIMRLDAFTALVAVTAMSVTVHIFAVVGVPVSTSQGIVGAIMGIGMMRGVRAVRFRSLGNIAVGWLLTPAVSLILAAAGYAIFAKT
ncbi:MAG: inorganic phosphate transporter [Candidatus Hydrogenedentes bacterium]|nr:inorganic phosphate transporter [Candidatus Hydrogenedentota bacterium]